MKLSDLKIPETLELIVVADSYDRDGNTQSCCYVFPDGTIENIRNKEMFLSFNIFNQFSSSDVTDFDGYIVPKGLPLCFFDSERDYENNVINTTVSFTENSSHLKDLVLEKYRLGLGELQTISVNEDLLATSLDEETFQECLENFKIEEFLENYFKNLDLSCYEREEYKTYISSNTRTIS